MRLYGLNNKIITPSRYGLTMWEPKHILSPTTAYQPLCEIKTKETSHYQYLGKPKIG